MAKSSKSIVFSGEMEVDGDLKVTGQIDASNQRIKNVAPPSNMTDAVNAQVLQDALRDEGNYEVAYYAVKFYEIEGSWIFRIEYKEIGATSYGGDWQTFVNEQLSNGWKINNIIRGDVGSHIHAVYELKRLLDE